jgi:hypothetical protein
MSGTANIKVVASNDAIFNGTVIDDVVLYTGTPSQKVFIGTSNGASMFTVTSNAVGIGKSNPGYPLDVVGDVNFTGTLRQNGVLYASGGGGSSQWSNTSSNVYLLSSNVGIGTSTPQYPLEVNGDVGITGNLNMVNKILTFGGLKITASSSNYGSVTTVLTLPGSSNEGSNLLLYASSNSASNYIRFAASNVELVRMTGNGYVGIGTSNPQYPLDVRGSLYSSNVYSVSSSNTNQSSSYISCITLSNTNQSSYIADFAQLRTGGVNRINALGDGSLGTVTFSNIGIANSNPSYPLDVIGNINCTGNIAAGNIGMFRNRIINGDMRIIQRGVTSSNMSAVSLSNIYTIDRFNILSSASGGTLTQAQNTLTISDTPFLYGFKSSWKITAATGVTGINYLAPGQRIEGYNVSDLNWGTTVGVAIVVSFWVKTNAATNSVVALTLRNGNFSYSYNVPVTITSTGSWQYVSVNVPAPPSGTTWATDKTNGIDILVGGYGSLTSSPNTWQSGNYIGTSTTTNIFATNGNYVEITGVQLEKGNIGTPFEFRPYGLELSLCQRYFEVVAQSAGYGMGYYNAPGGGYNLHFNFKVSKRDTPTLYSGSVVAPLGGTSISQTMFNVDQVGWYMSLTGASGFYYSVTGPLAFAAEL